MPSANPRRHRRSRRPSRRTPLRLAPLALHPSFPLLTSSLLTSSLLNLLLFLSPRSLLTPFLTPLLLSPSSLIRPPSPSILAITRRVGRFSRYPAGIYPQGTPFLALPCGQTPAGYPHFRPTLRVPIVSRRNFRPNQVRTPHFPTRCPESAITSGRRM